jgi:hypothetical protein
MALLVLVLMLLLSNLIVVAIASNYTIAASYSIKVQMQQLVVIQT